LTVIRQRNDPTIRVHRDAPFYPLGELVAELKADEPDNREATPGPWRVFDAFTDVEIVTDRPADKQPYAIALGDRRLMAMMSAPRAR
jgi:hypothetical protein